MARLMLMGSFAWVEFTWTDDDELWSATCVKHVESGEGCSWTEVYDALDDAVEDATGHVERGGHQ